MARFRFELEPVLNARRQIEREQQRAVADLEASRRRLEDQLRNHQEFITDGKKALRERLVGVIDADGLRDHAAASMRLMRETHQLVIELARVHHKLEAARANLIEAARDRRVIEILREKRFAEWKHRLGRAEDAALDELAVQHARAR